MALAGALCACLHVVGGFTNRSLRAPLVTFDILALCRDQPGIAVRLAALREAGPELKVDTIEQA